MGLLGRRLAGPPVGLVAAAIAALDPLWVQQSGFVISESIYLIVIPTMLLIALRCIDRPNLWDIAVLGILIGLATLTRSEAVDFVVFLGAPVVVLAVHRWRDRVLFGLVLVAGVGLLVGPWLIRNDLEMGAFILSSNGGDTLSGSYCPPTYSPKSPDYGRGSRHPQARPKPGLRPAGAKRRPGQGVIAGGSRGVVPPGITVTGRCWSRTSC